MIGAFLAGLTYPFRALVLLARLPQLWAYVIVPILLNLAVGALLYGGLLFVGLKWVDAAVANTGFGAVLGALLRVLLIVGLLIAIGFLLVRFGVVLGSPWYSQLSQKLEELRLGSAPPAEPLSAFGVLRDVGRALGFELKKLLLVLAVGALLLLVNLLPFAGQLIDLIGWIALGVTISCLDFFDYPLERRRLGFRRKLGVIRNSLPGSAGFGLVCLGLVSIPLINLLSIPVCVAAGTLFFCDRVRANR
jgi:CysZ protein